MTATAPYPRNFLSVMVNRLPFLIVAFLLAVAPGPVALHAQDAPRTPQELARAIDALLRADAYENAIWSGVVIDLSTDEVLYQRMLRTSLMPASNGKLFSTAAVLDQLGPDYVYETHVYADGPIEDGILKGNLIVRGSGDPVIGGRFNRGDMTEALRTWAETLRTMGIYAIEGDLIGDDDIFDDTPLGPGWSWDDEPFDYSAEIGGLSFNDNTVSVILEGTQAGRPAQMRWDPFNTSYVEMINKAITMPSGTRKDEEIERERASNVITVATRIPAGRIDTTALAVPNPTRYFLHVFRDVLRDSRIEVRGALVDVDDMGIKPTYEGAAFARLLTHRSPPMADIVEVINKESQNLYAEQVLRTLGVVFPVADPDIDRGSTEMGVEAALATFAAAGVDTSRLQMADGSGLSRMNLVTAEMTARVLAYMWKHPRPDVREAFVNSLPIAGVDGTLERRMRRGPAYANARAKTGTLTGTSNLSGYVTAADGTPLLFVLMCNNHTLRASTVHRTQDAILHLLAGFRR